MKNKFEIHQRRDIERQPLDPRRGKPASQLPVRISCGDFPEVKVHYLTDHELQNLLQRTESHTLTLATSSLSAGLAFMVPLFSTMVTHRTVFTALGSGFLFAGIAFGIVWRRDRKAVGNTVSRIIARLKKGAD
jgi:phage head maturation protease